MNNNKRINLIMGNKLNDDALCYMFVNQKNNKKNFNTNSNRLPILNSNHNKMNKSEKKFNLNKGSKQ